MPRMPVNVAFAPAVIQRIRILAAQRNERVADTVEALVLESIGNFELQALADQRAIKPRFASICECGRRKETDRAYCHKCSING